MGSAQNSIKALFCFAVATGGITLIVASQLFEQPHLWPHQEFDSALVTSKLGFALALPCIAFALVLEVGLKRLANTQTRSS